MNVAEKVVKVIVEVRLDFSEESDKALRRVFYVAEELLDKYGVWVEIIPEHVWFTDPLEAEVMDLPQIYINGKLRFIGRAPSISDLKSAIMEKVGVQPAKREEAGIVGTKLYDGGGIGDAVLAF
ncbi:MAG: thioredoxin family protein [Desulfurococcus sp.]|nr:thioredoxin family protein [Desulfurococcus sp.]